MNNLMITTDCLAPKEGLIYPSVGGIYLINYSIKNGAFIEVEKHSDFIKVLPARFKSLFIKSYVKNKDQVNLIDVNFITSVDIDAYSAGGRIRFELPTIDAAAINVFPLDLGYINLTTNELGCYVNGLSPEATKIVKCMISRSLAAPAPISIEVQDFAAFLKDTEILVSFVVLKNPSVVRPDADIKVSVYTFNAGVIAEIHSELVSVFIDI